MKRFEYDVVYMKTEVTDVSSQGAISHHVRKVLNAMGKDGWELVSVAQDQTQIRFVPEARVDRDQIACVKG